MTRRRRQTEALEISERTLERLVHIIGPSAAAAVALADLKRRRAEGESPRCYLTGSTLLVGTEITP